MDDQTNPPKPPTTTSNVIDFFTRKRINLLSSEVYEPEIKHTPQSLFQSILDGNIMQDMQEVIVLGFPKDTDDDTPLTYLSTLDDPRDIYIHLDAFRYGMMGVPYEGVPHEEELSFDMIDEEDDDD